MRTSNTKVIAIFIAKGCNYGKTCKALGISRTTLFRWREEDETLDIGLVEARESIIDELEDVALKMARGVPLIKEIENEDGTITHAFAGWDVEPHLGFWREIMGARGLKRGYGKSRKIGGDINDDSVTNIQINIQGVDLGNVEEVKKKLNAKNKP